MNNTKGTIIIIIISNICKIHEYIWYPLLFLLGKHRLEIPNEVGVFCLVRNYYFMLVWSNIETPKRKWEADSEVIQEIIGSL